MDCKNCNGTGVEPTADGLECHVCKRPMQVEMYNASGVMTGVGEFVGDVADAVADFFIWEAIGDVASGVAECVGDAIGAAFD